MKKIALIPARGGSKRIPKKNIKFFLGKPIIAYPIEALATSGFFDDIIISTDDKHIQDIAKQYGGSVPFTRPYALSGDYTTTREVVIHAIDTLCLNEQDMVCCVYPTSVFLTHNSLKEGYEALLEHFCFSLSAVAYDYPVYRSFVVSQDRAITLLYQDMLNERSQDLQKVYHDAAQFYWGSVKEWKSQTPLFSECSYAVIMPSSCVQDIDTLDDWKIAEIKYTLLHKAN